MNPGEIEVLASYSRHLGATFDAAGLRIQFHYNQIPASTKAEDNR